MEYRRASRLHAADWSSKLSSDSTSRGSFPAASTNLSTLQLNDAWLVSRQDDRTTKRSCNRLRERDSWSRKMIRSRTGKPVCQLSLLTPSRGESNRQTPTIRVFTAANGPVLLLLDEVLNFVNRHRGMADGFHAFIQNLTVAVAGTTKAAAVISLPRSQVEMSEMGSAMAGSDHEDRSACRQGPHRQR